MARPRPRHQQPDALARARLARARMDGGHGQVGARLRGVDGPGVGDPQDDGDGLVGARAHDVAHDVGVGRVQGLGQAVDGAYRIGDGLGQASLLIGRHVRDVHAIERGQVRSRRGRGVQPRQPVTLGREGGQVVRPGGIVRAGRVDIPGRVPGHRSPAAYASSAERGTSRRRPICRLASWPESRAA